MLVLIIFLFFLWIFYREILFSICLLILRPKKIDNRKYAVIVQAQKQILPELFIYEKGSFEALIFSQWARSELLVSKDFWNQLSETEKDCLLAWTHCAARGTSLAQRIFGFFRVEKIDRQCLHWGIPALDLVSVIEKAKAYRRSAQLGLFESFIEGLTPSGSSLFKDWITTEERLRKIGLEASKIVDSKP